MTTTASDTRAKKTAIRRFMAKTLPPKNPSGCWEWVGRVQPNGYGQFHLDGKTEYAHRASVMLFREGGLPDGLNALHACDNRRCVRFGPGHIFVGTQSENMLDAFAKGRHTAPVADNRGEKQGRSKLTADKAATIRARATAGESQTALATAYGVSQSTISRVVNRAALGGWSW